MTKPAFLYFVGCGSSRESIDVSKISVFSDLFPSGVSCLRPQKGPGKEGGLLVMDAERFDVSRLRYVPDSQEWAVWGDISIAGQVWPVWVGMWTDWKPGPEDIRLRARRPRETFPVALGDGGTWALPRLRYITGETGLECQLYVGEGENVEWRVAKRFEDLCARGERYFCQWAGVPDDAPALTFREQFQILMDSLGVVYHIGSPEINLLGLFTSWNVGEALRVLIDGDAFEDLVKKKIAEDNLTKTESENSGPTG